MYNKEDLQLTYPIGTAVDPEGEEITIKYDMDSGLQSVVSFTDEAGKITMAVDMESFYASDIMPEMDTDLTEKVTITISDGDLEKTVEFEIKFTGKAEYKEEEVIKEEEPAVEEEKEEEEQKEEVVEEEEVKEEVVETKTNEEVSVFIPTFDKPVEVEKPKQNVPVAVADAEVP